MRGCIGGKASLRVGSSCIGGLCGACAGRCGEGLACSIVGLYCAWPEGCEEGCGREECGSEGRGGEGRGGEGRGGEGCGFVCIEVVGGTSGGP